MSAPALLEADFQLQVTQLAELRGWEWMHCRAGRTRDSWRTPLSGTMAKGWPDLVMLRAESHRLIFAELKRDDAKLTVEQQRVVAVLRAGAAPRFTATWLGWEVYVWRPKDWSFIEAMLA